MGHAPLPIQPSAGMTRGDMATHDADVPTRTAGRRAALLLTAGLLASYAYFYQAGGWNQNSRFALVRAIVEHGTLRIDETFRWDGKDVTGDLAHLGGHTYSDKAPGLAFAAVPVVATARLFLGAADTKPRIALLSYVATVAVAAVPTALAALLVFWLATTLGASPGGGLFAAATFGLGTPAWCYATLLFGHGLAIGCVVAAFAAAVALREAQSAIRDRVLAAGTGLAAGWATITEYPTAVPAAIIAALALVHAWPGGKQRRLRVAGALVASAAACFAVLLAYNQAAFGAPLKIGYGFEQGFGGMQQGFLGLTYPKRYALVELLVGRYRGLLFLAPVLALAPWGLARLVRAPASRRPAIAATAIVAYYIVFNSSYYYWSGGWSYGPRHLAPALPFLCLALAPLWTSASPAWRAALAAPALYGSILALMAVAVTAQPSTDYAHPVEQLIWPSFRRGELSANKQSFVEMSQAKVRDPVAHAWNLGEKLGLEGKASLLPLLGVWGVLGGAWLSGRRSGRYAPSPARSVREREQKDDEPR